MTDLMIFENSEFGTLRTTYIDGELYFVGKDVAAALGYKDTSDALKKHVDDEDKGVGELPTRGGIQNMIVISESGLYSLVLSSKLESAKKFKHWVTSEVLPSIRKTGGYKITREDSPVEKGDFLLRCAEMVKTQNWKELLVRGAANMVAGYELLPPLQMPKTYSATEVAKMFGVSPNLVGRIATKHGLKKDEYGVWCHDIARNGQKEVEVFRYNDNGVDAISNYINN